MPAATVHDLFLYPGQWVVGDAGRRMRTLLGSCVSITLWHRQAKIGAMSHFLLAGRAAGVRDARFSEDALALMCEGLRAAGVAPVECEAKIFGGGNMFPAQAGAAMCGIGQKNGHAAQALLRAHGIAVVSSCLFGVGHRQIVFDVASGDVWVRQVRPAPIQAELECA